jgi:alpha-ketoglutarate-dependent taurine dioxygenase
VPSVSELEAQTDDPRSWTAATVGAMTAWTHRLTDALTARLRAIAEAYGRCDEPVTELRLSAGQKAGLGPFLAGAKHELELGRGFVILDRLPLDVVTEQAATAFYWLLGQLLGEPVAQNVQGTVLYDVRDSGQEVAQGARFSVTRYESSFHTDNSFGDSVVDYVGLLCLMTARSGGVSQVVSGLTAMEVLDHEHPEALDALCRPFHVDRRGGIRSGEAATVLRPAIQREGAEPLFRYLRHWIEAGHEKAGVPLTPEERAALDTLDEILNRPALRAEFSLEPGQMYFINNRWILHNRTAFEDHPEPERRRHLVRLWLERAMAVGV